MKISPVTSPTPMTNIAGVGLSPEKLQRITRIAEGGIEPKTPAPAEATPPAETVETTTPSAISDSSVQTNAAPEATGALSPQLAAIAKQRRALQVQERDLKAREEAITAQAGQSIEALKARAQTNALGVLQELDIPYDRLTTELLANQNGYNPEIAALKNEIKSLKEEVNKTFTDKETAQEQAVLKQIRSNVDSMSFSDDAYELIRATQSQADVVQFIHEIYKKSGKVVDEDVAMKAIEDELYEDAKKLAKIKKMQGILTPPQQAAASATQDQGLRTLTNKDSARPTLSRRQRAMNAMLGQK